MRVLTLINILILFVTFFRQNQSLPGAGVGVGVGATQKESSRAPPQPPLYQHAAHPGYSVVVIAFKTIIPNRHNLTFRYYFLQPRANSLYAQSMYHQYTPGKSPMGTPEYPRCPDVKLKKLPFYDILADILKPSSLIPSPTQRVQEAMFSFYLTPQQATDIATGRDIVGVSNKLENIVQVSLSVFIDI